MNYRDFKAAVALEANEPRDYEQIVFRTPDGTTYNNIKVNFTTLANSKHNVILVDLFNIKPKFKVGDIVCNNSGLYPNVKCTIAEVNEELQYYSYKEINGRTYFKDQDKLTLVNNEEVRPPVEGDIRLSLDATIARQNVQIYNHNTYEQFALIDKFIDERSKTGYNSYTAMLSTTVFHHDKTGKILVLSDLVDRIVNHYTNLGFTVNTDKDDNNYKILIEW